MAKNPTENESNSTINLIISDSIVSFIWVFSGSVIRYIAYNFLGLGAHNPLALIFKGSLAVLYLVFFAWVRKATRGAYNPLMVLCHGINGSFSGFLFTVFARIPVQAFGWAYVQGNYNTKEHVYVYWLAPIEATLLGVWICSVLVKPKQQEQKCKLNTTVKQSKKFAWMDAAERNLATKKHLSTPIFSGMDMQFCFSPRGGPRGGYRKNARTLE